LAKTKAGNSPQFFQNWRLSPKRQMSSGVDVMITIFCHFWQVSAKKLEFFSKTNVMIKILHNLALFWVKNAIFFAEFYGKNIFKIITSVPGLFSRTLKNISLDIARHPAITIRLFLIGVAQCRVASRDRIFFVRLNRPSRHCLNKTRRYALWTGLTLPKWGSCQQRRRRRRTVVTIKLLLTKK
jgi:hypothetical protein